MAAGSTASWLFSRIVYWCEKHETDGLFIADYLPGIWHPTHERPQYEQLMKKLLDVGLIAKIEPENRDNEIVTALRIRDDQVAYSVVDFDKIAKTRKRRQKAKASNSARQQRLRDKRKNEKHNGVTVPIYKEYINTRSRSVENEKAENPKGAPSEELRPSTKPSLTEGVRFMLQGLREIGWTDEYNKGVAILRTVSDVTIAEAEQILAALAKQDIKKRHPGYARTSILKLREKKAQQAKRAEQRTTQPKPEPVRQVPEAETAQEHKPEPLRRGPSSLTPVSKLISLDVFASQYEVDPRLDELCRRLAAGIITPREFREQSELINGLRRTG